MSASFDVWSAMLSDAQTLSFPELISEGTGRISVPVELATTGAGRGR
eukprot:gene2747-8376_t